MKIKHIVKRTETERNEFGTQTESNSKKKVTRVIVRRLRVLKVLQSVDAFAVWRLSNCFQDNFSATSPTPNSRVCIANKVVQFSRALHQ